MITQPIGQRGCRQSERTRAPRGLTGGLLLVALLAAGCTNRDTSGRDAGADGHDTGLDSFIEQLAHSMCAWQFRCCTLPEIDSIGQSTYLTEATCRSATIRQLNLQLAEVRLAIEDGRMALDPQVSGACAAQFDQAACNAPEINLLNAPPSVSERLAQCASPFVGKVALKGACTLPSECLPGSSCGVGSGQISENGLRMRPQLTSEVPGVPNHCQPDRKEGESCLSTLECSVGLYCRHPDLVCARPAAEGEACNQPRGFMGEVLATFGACAEGLRRLLCVADRCRHSPRQDEPCLPETGTAPVCDTASEEPLVCVGQGFNGTGICKRRGEKWDSCSIGAGVSPCADPWVCQNDLTGVGTCQPAPAAGAPCGGDGRCAAPAVCYAPTDICVIPPVVPDGKPCDSDLDCASLTCAPSLSQTGSMGICVPFGTAACFGAGASSAPGRTPPADMDAGVAEQPDARMGMDARTSMF